MDEENIPIDINTNKLLDWLISRRHVSKDWQNSIINIRQQIGNAIQDMPAHEGIVKLLSGQHIHYFHCLKIVEILKETEADTKNVFGRYGSQRMKDWQNIVSAYQKDNIYLAEVAQMLIRNVNYEIPSLRKQISKLEQSQVDSEKKIKEYSKSEATVLKEFNSSCEQLGISGKDIKNELLALVRELPTLYDQVAEKIKPVGVGIELYAEFRKYLTGISHDVVVLPSLSFLVEKGNTTTYEYTYGEKPVKVETEEVDEESLIDENPEAEIDFGEISLVNDAIDFGDSTPAENIDWGNGNTDDGFEIIEHVDLDINLEESGIVVEKSGHEGGIAKGENALTILDNPKIHDKIVNDLLELQAFLKMRLFEMLNDTDLLTVSHMQDAPTLLQMQTAESIASLMDQVNIALFELTNKRIQHLHNVKHSPKYVDILTASLNQKLSVADRMKMNKSLLEKKILQCREEARKLQKVVDGLILQSKQLQKDIEVDISNKYKGRIVNIVGGVNIL